MYFLEINELADCSMKKVSFVAGFLLVFSAVTIAHEFNLDGSANTPTIRVASYNIMASRMGDSAAIAGAIKAMDADLIALQEVDNETVRSIANFGHANAEPVNQIQYFADEVDMHAGFCSAISFDSGEYGHGVLSKHPLTLVKRLVLPNKANNEQRSACAFKVQVPNYPAPVLLVSTHLEDKDALLRKEQVRVIMSQFSAWEFADSIVLLLGDFNFTPKSQEYTELSQWFSLADSNAQYTAPSWNPDRKLDYIFTSTAQRWLIEGVKVPFGQDRVGSKMWYQVSDHLPLIVDMKLVER